jgi:hypothetical protein
MAAATLSSDSIKERLARYVTIQEVDNVPITAGLHSVGCSVPPTSTQEYIDEQAELVVRTFVLAIKEKMIQRVYKVQVDEMGVDHEGNKIYRTDVYM